MSEKKPYLYELGQRQATHLKHIAPLYEVLVVGAHLSQRSRFWMVLGKFKQDENHSRYDQVNNALCGEDFKMHRLDDDALRHLGKLPITHEVDGLLGVDLFKTVQKQPNLVKYLHHELKSAD